MKILKIQPAMTQQAYIQESLSFEGNVLKNRIWYRGDPYELDQFFKQASNDEITRARFWSAVPSQTASIRKYHSGLPGEIVDKLADIVISDLDAVIVDREEDPDGTGELKSPAQEIWDEIAEENKFNDELMADAIKEVLSVGDGAFKLSVDKDISDYPIIEFFSGENLKYNYKRGRLQGITFFTHLTHEKRSYRLEETYTKGEISYKLFESDNKEELPLTTIPELADTIDYTFRGDFIAAVPFKILKSSKFEGRGQSIYDRKTDNFDALDEVVSQWIDAIRAGRVKNYIPEDLLPKDSKSGEVLPANPFDNMYIQRSTSMKENAEDKIDQIQAVIDYVAYLESYAAAVDMCLQGVMSPSTLGIDLKKTDNALAQREKEKTTLYTRAKVLDVLNEIIPELVRVTLNVYDTMNMRAIKEHDVSVQFGEYASPDFNEKVEVVGQARAYGIMSLEKAINELYGDTLTDEQKEEEVNKIREELRGITEEPALNIDGLGLGEEIDEEDDI